MKRIIAVTAGVLAITAGLFFAFAYAIHAPEDFHNPNVPFRDALLAVLIGALLSIAPVVLGIRFVRFGLHRRPEP